MKSLELSKKATFLILISVLSAYVGLSFHELFEPECSGVGDCYDYDRRMSRLAVWDVNWVFDDFRHVIHLGLLTLSDQLFGNAKFLVLVSSVVLLVVTYLFTLNVTGKRLCGIISVGIVLSSNIFRLYDTSVTYPSFWTTLYISTLYLLTTRFWGFSPITYLVSIPSKAITALFFPATIGFVLLSDNQTRRNKLKIIFVYFAMFVAGVVALISVDVIRAGESGGFLIFTDFRPVDFALGFVSWMWKGFGGDQSTLLMMIVFGFMVFMNRKVLRNSTAILVLVAGIVFLSPVLIGMTTYDVWPYRELPLVILTGVLGGMLIGNFEKINLSMFNLSKATERPTSNNKEDKQSKQ